MRSRVAGALLALGCVACGGADTALQADSQATRTGSITPRAQEHYRRARAFLAVRAPLKAVEEVRAALQREPDWFAAHRLYIDAHRYSEAVEGSTIAEYGRYAQAHPQDARARYLLARSYRQAWRNEEAEAAVDEALRLDPEMPWAWLERGLLARRQGRGDEARQAIANARERVAAEDLDLRLAIAEELYETQQAAEALAEVRAILERDAQYFAAYPLWWQARITQADDPERVARMVLQEIRRLEAKFPVEPEALAAAWWAYVQHPDEEGVREYYRLDAQLFRQFRLDEVVGRSWTDSPVRRRVHWRGRLAARFNRAHDPFRARESPPRSIDARAQLRAYRLIDRELGEDRPRHQILYPAILETAGRLGDIETMAEIVERLARADVATPLLTHARLALAHAYLDTEAFEQAAEQAGQVLPQDIERDVASLFTERPKSDDEDLRARAARRAWRKRAWSLADALDVRGQVQLARELSDDAVRTLETAVRLAEADETYEPRDYPDYLLHLGRAYLAAGRVDEAVDTTARAHARFADLAAKVEQAERRMARRTDPSLFGPIVSAAAETPSRILPSWLYTEMRQRVGRSVPPVWDGRHQLDADLASIRTAMASVHRVRDPRTSFEDWWDRAVEQAEARVAARKHAQAAAALVTAEAAEAAPAFELTGISGTRRRLADLSGRVVVLNFWATWCSPCRQEYPILQKLQQTYGDQGVAVLMVSIDEYRHKIPEFVAERGLSAEILFADDEVQGRYGVTGIPATFLIDGMGRLRYRHTGLMDEATIVGHVQALLDEDTTSRG